METIKYKKQFIEKLRRMRERNQIGKIVRKGLVESCWRDPIDCVNVCMIAMSDCVNVCMVGMSDWFGNYL